MVKSGQSIFLLIICFVSTGGVTGGVTGGSSFSDDSFFMIKTMLIFSSRTDLDSCCLARKEMDRDSTTVF